MSISVRRAIDTRVDGASSVNVHHDFATGASSATWQSFDATSKSSGSLEFNVLVPGQNAYWNRQVMLETSVAFIGTPASWTNAGAVGGGTAFRNGRDVSTCGFPMNSLMQTVTTSINGSTITTQQSQIMPLVRRLIACNDKSRKALPCPSGVGLFADNSDSGQTEANEIMSIPRAADRAPSNGSFRVLEWGYITTASGEFTPFTDSTAYTLSTVFAAGTVAGFRITTREPLLASPFITSNDEPAFTNVQSANIRCTLLSPSDPAVRILRTNRSFGTGRNAANGTLDDTYSTDALKPPACAITGIAYASAQPFVTAKLWCNFLSPSPDQLVPSSTIYPYLQFDPLQTAQAAIVPNAIRGGDTYGAGVNAAQCISQTVILNTCPDMLAVYVSLGDIVGVADAATGLYNAGTFSGREDLFATIDNISITWNNQPSILQSARPHDLWRMTYDNGLRLPYDIYSGLKNGDRPLPTANSLYPLAVPKNTFPSTGMPLLLAINKDFPTEPGTAPGVAGVFSMTITANVHTYGQTNYTASYPGADGACTSAGAVARPATMYVVPIRSQYLQLNAGGTSAVVGAVSSGEAMLDAPFTSDRVIGSLPNMVGGWGFNMGSIANLASKAKNAWERGRQIAETAKKAHDLYKEHEGAIRGAIDTGKAAYDKLKSGEGGEGAMGHGVQGYGSGVIGGKRARLHDATSAYSRMS